jgi:hypothetical protein
MNENVLVVLLVIATGGMAGVIVLGMRAIASVAGYRKVAQARRGAEHDPQKSHDGYERPEPRAVQIPGRDEYLFRVPPYVQLDDPTGPIDPDMTGALPMARVLADPPSTTWRSNGDKTSTRQ